MNFKEAYALMSEGKRVCKEGLGINQQDGSQSIKYLTMINVVYLENGAMIKQDPSFIVAVDEKNTLTRLSDQNVISLLMSVDEDWSEYVEPQLTAEAIHECVTAAAKEFEAVAE